MKDRTQEEILDFIYETWEITKPDPKKERNWRRDSRDDPRVYVYNDSVNITLTNWPGFTFKQMMALAEFFETDNIEDMDHTYSSGCDTCDYGSTKEFTLEIKPGKWPLGGNNDN